MWEITKPILDEEMQWQAAENHGIVKNKYRNKFIRLINLEGEAL